jgi:flagellin
MNGSILTNQGAMVALQTMKSINKDLGGVQDMISTGKKVATSKDNAAIWAISSVMESDVSAFKAVSDSLALGQSTVSVARNASEQVKDSLVEIKDKIIAAQEENVDREKIQSDVEAIRSQIKSIVGASQFNGLNLLKSEENLDILSSLDRSSNGSVTTSNITVEAKSLNSGTSADSVAGNDIVAAVNDGPVITAELGVTGTGTVTDDGIATTTEFTNSTQDFTFSTAEALDEGDSVAFSLTDGTDTATFTYTQTAAGDAVTSGEELAKQLTNAYTAFAARDADGNGVDIGDGTNVGDYDSATQTFTAAEGNFVVTGTNAENLNTLSLTENAGTITAVNQRDTAVTFSIGTEVDRVETDLGAIAEGDGTVVAIDASAGGTGTANLDLTNANASGIQSDDTYAVTLDFDDATDSAALTVSITGADQTNAQLADSVSRILNAVKDGDITTGSTTYAGGDSEITSTGNAGEYTVNGATISLSYNDNTGGGGTIAEGVFVAGLNGAGTPAESLDISNTASSVVTFDNNSLSGGNDHDFSVAATLTTPAASVATSADIAITGTGADNIAAGTIGDFTTIDVNNTSTQDGDTLSITIEGANLDADSVAQPITYTTTNIADPDATAAGFAAAINTALGDSGVTDFVATASTDASGTVSLKNYNSTTTRDVSELSVVNELTTAAVATDSAGVAATTITAGETNNVTFAKTTPTKGDTYSITVGDTTASYTARDGDDLNDVGTNLEGLLKIGTSDDIEVDFTSVDDPASTDSVLTVKNNSTSTIDTFSATVKSGGTAGGGLELLDDIDVSTASKAEGSLDLIEGLINVAIDAAASYGSSEKRLEGQQDFISQLTDSLQSGIGSLVDANLEETSARLQALQVQQQLGTQALSIANQAPQNILSLFR